MSVIHISKRENPYVQIDKRVLEDPRLTWRSKGILAYLLSKPSGWKVNVKDIWNNGAEGRNAVQDCLVELQKIGYAKLITISGEQGKLMGSQWQVTEEPIGGFPVNAERPRTGSPTNRKSGSRVHSNNESLSEINSNSEGERTPPAPNPSTSKEEKKENGLVAPGRCDANDFFAKKSAETLKAKTAPLPKVAPKGIPPKDEMYCPDCGVCLDFGRCPECGEYPENPICRDKPFEATAIASPTDIPGVTLVEAANQYPKLSETDIERMKAKNAEQTKELLQGDWIRPKQARVTTTLEAESKISEWIAGDGLETVKHRYNTAKQRFDPENAAAIAAHYCSVYTKHPANKERLLKDPVTHFSDGLFSYLKNEEAFGRNNGPGNNGATRGGQEQPKTLTSNMRQL